MKYQVVSAILVLINFYNLLAEVTVFKSEQVIYDTTRTLRLKGSGFYVNDHDIILQLSNQVDKNYLITKDADGDELILTLAGNRQWLGLSESVSPYPFILSSVKFSNSDKNLLSEPVVVAHVFITPRVYDNNKYLYMSASNELRISGSGFNGAKRVDLYFQPPLVKDVAYEDVSKYPLVKNEVVLRLRYGYSWRESPGVLYVIGVDTGGGPVKVDGHAGAGTGAKVADVLDNHDLHAVQVDDTSETQLLYADEANLIIKGSGFNPVGNLLRFSNGLLGNNVNYTTVSTTETSINLRIVPGSFWRKNFANLPGALTLLAVNAGAGYVAVGPLNTQIGNDVAMVFEHPEVHSDNIRIYRTHSHEFHVKGKGFPELRSGYKPSLRFSPALTEGIDYTTRVVDRTILELTLLNGRAWRASVGPLIISAINTRGDTNGWVNLPGDGVFVAEVVEDIDASAIGGIEIFPMGIKVYQSLLQKEIVVIGTGFRKSMSLNLLPHLTEGKDYELEVQSKNKAVLRLMYGKKWRADPGPIVVSSIRLDSKEYNLTGSGSEENSQGIHIALVLPDPVINPSTNLIYESQAKGLLISMVHYNHIFTNVADTKISLRPTPPDAYRINGVFEDRIQVQLNPDKRWLPSSMSLKGEEVDKKIILQVASIDTGAGEVTFDNPVTVGYIVQDPVPVSYIVQDSHVAPSTREVDTDCQNCGPVGADNFTLFDNIRRTMHPGLNESIVRSKHDLEEKHSADSAISNANMTTNKHYSSLSREKANISMHQNQKEKTVLNMKYMKEHHSNHTGSLQLSLDNRAVMMEFRRWRVEANLEAKERRAKAAEDAEDLRTKRLMRNAVVTALIAQNKTPDEIRLYLTMLKEMDQNI